MFGLDNPLALLGLILLPAVYFLYWKTLRIPVRVPSVMLWRKAGGRSDGVRGVERKFDIRLLLYLAAILAGVLAASRPVIKHQGLAPARNAVVVGKEGFATDSGEQRVVRTYGVRDRYLEKALRAILHVETEDVWDGEPESGPAVLMGVSCDRLPTGDIAVINPKGKIGPITIEGKRGITRLVVEEPGHPLLEGVDVKRIDIKEVLVGSFPEELKALISADGIPVIAVMPNGSGTLLYVGFNMAETEWHAYPSFPIFWCNFFGRPAREVSVGASLSRPRAGTSVGARNRDANLSWVFLVLMLAAIAGLWTLPDRS